jgi:uncharacterized protein (TIGR02271 family)
MGEGDEPITVERREEQLDPRIRRETVGRVVVRRRVETDAARAEVTLERDQVRVERTPVERPLEAGEASISTRGDETIVLVIEERLDVRKVPWVIEEVHIRRQTASRPQEITGSVRRERIEVQTEGDLAVDEAG